MMSATTHVLLTLALASGCCMWTTQVSAAQELPPVSQERVSRDLRSGRRCYEVSPSDCADIAKYGKCHRYLKECPVSCGVCPGKECKNLGFDRECKRGAKWGHCKTQPEYMTRMCRKACGLCKQPACHNRDVHDLKDSLASLKGEIEKMKRGKVTHLCNGADCKIVEDPEETFKCFKYVGEWSNHKDAQYACRNMNADLAEPSNVNEYEFLKDLVKKSKVFKPIWLGGKQTMPRTWTWEKSGLPVSDDLPWYSVNDKLHHSHKCLRMASDENNNSMAAAGCDWKSFFICQITSSGPCNEDSFS